MASVGAHAVRPFVSPFAGSQPATANDVRGNDNQLRVYHNAHDADASVHVQSGTLANRPATLAEGSTYFATDTQDTFTYTGGGWVQTGWAHWYGMVYSTADQAAANPDEETIATFTATRALRGVSLVSSTRLTVAYAGDYNVQFSAQLANPDASECDVWFWLKKNGTTLANTAGRVTVPKKHGSTNGHALVAWNEFLTLAATDYLELAWQTQNVLTTLETVAASGDAPDSPSVFLTIARC